MKISKDNYINMAFIYGETIDIKKVYIDVAGDILSGILLNQIIYWHLPNEEEGEPQLVIHKDSYEWLVKPEKEWWDELRLTVEQSVKALEDLEEKNLIVTKVCKVAGIPTTHIRINWDVFLKELKHTIKNTKVYENLLSSMKL